MVVTEILEWLTVLESWAKTEIYEKLVELHCDMSTKCDLWLLMEESID